MVMPPPGGLFSCRRGGSGRGEVIANRRWSDHSPEEIIRSGSGDGKEEKKEEEEKGRGR